VLRRIAATPPAAPITALEPADPKRQPFVFEYEFRISELVSSATDLWQEKHSFAYSHGGLGQHHLHF
jgi:hypothetical protein